MPTVERVPFLARSLRPVVSTNVASESPITRDYGREDAAREAWGLVEKQLIEWGCDPSQLDEENTQTPSGDTIRLAIQLATALGRHGSAAPTRAVPDAHGGIVFEVQGKSIFESVHVEPDGSIEHRLFKDDRLVLRETWMLETVDNE